MLVALVLCLSVAIVAIGLVAGYVLAYSNSVMPGLAKSDDRTFVAANQRLNQAVHNPLFMALSNIGPLALIVSTALLIADPAGIALPLTFGAVTLYGVTLALTLGVNMPMNNRLISLGAVEDAEQLAQARTAFEQRWTRMNVARTWTTALSCALALGALVTVQLTAG